MTRVNTKDTDWYLHRSQLEAKDIAFAIEVDISDSSVKESIPKDWPLVPTVSVENSRRYDSSDQSVNGWITRVREKLYSNTAVEDIFVKIEDNDIDVWVVTSKREIGVLRQIVEKEDELLKTLVSGDNPALFIDFHVIYRCGRNIEELVPTRAIRIQRGVHKGA